MSNVNITEVHLLNAPLENDYKITLYFPNKNNQTEYFKKQIKHSYLECSYQRKEGFFRAYAHIDSLYDCNYVMYKNSAYTDRWFYAFITDMKYVDDGRTDVYIETDVMQTWMFDYTVKPSFVEREHVMDDTVGIHTVPEGLETGDYVCNARIKNNSLTSIGFVIAATIDLKAEDLKSDDVNVSGGFYNGTYSGLKYFYFATSNTANDILNKVAKAGKSDSISAIFAVPIHYLSQTNNIIDVDNAGTDNEGGVGKPKTRKWSEHIFGLSQTDIPIAETVNGYTPLNKKLLSYPYSYLLMSNNAGGSALYKYELFNSTLCDFQIEYALCPGGSLHIVPLNYNGVDINYEERLTGAKFPICNWNTDVYMNWLTQNSVNQALSIAGSIGTIAGGIVATATGAGATAGLPMIAGGVLGIGHTLSEKYSHSLVPPHAEGNVNNGDVTFGGGNCTFTAYKMSIKKEYAEIIDNYFSMFGYKLNLVKTPYKAHRKHYWYTKTIDVNLDGHIPQTDLQKIKECYNNGITFWRNDGTIGNYSDKVMQENAL